MPTSVRAVVPVRSRAGGDRAGLSSDLLFIGDLLCVLGTAVWTGLLRWPLAAPRGLDSTSATALVATVVTGFILHDPDFGSLAMRRLTGALVRSHLLRLAGCAAMVGALDLVSPGLHAAPAGALQAWFALVLASTSLGRWLLAAILRRLQRSGRLVERIALVGAGPGADHLARQLAASDERLVEVLGVFDDRSSERSACAQLPRGTLAQLIELGKTDRIDGIVLTLPGDATQRVQSILMSLKSLSVPISLCPVGKDGRAGRRATGPSATAHREFVFDDYTLEQFASVAARFGQAEYGYAVTPNVDHLIRLHDDPAYRALYADARFILLDSRFLSHLLRLTRGIRLPVCTGSDLLARLFADVIRSDDAVVLIGGTASQARSLSERYGLTGLVHFSPAMGFIRDPAAVEDCLRFIEAHSPFRFCLLAVGAPQQELLAHGLQARGVARGLALCIGAAVNFLTGNERRAPRWMQLTGSEWLFRLLQDPQRLGRRYLVRGPRVFGVLWAASLALRTSDDDHGAERASTAALLPADSVRQRTDPRGVAGAS